MEQDIFAAISADNKDRVREIIAQHPDVAHARNQAGVTALMQARYENKLEIVALLRNSARELDVFEAAVVGDSAGLQALLAKDSTLVKAQSSDGFTPLHLACFFGQLEAAETLIHHQADVDAVSPSRIAVIHSAAASRNAALVKLVLLAGANPNLQQQGGYTALHEAAMHNSVERAQALLDAGAARGIRSDDGLTAAEMAAQKGNKEVLELLTAPARS
ncbi:MAG TPA: ankyrin repeat domain-containing protein [Terriglobales bacterium]|nr:ankyrin repeat domain-containing protein [Terriglobales bacterium]